MKRFDENGTLGIFALLLYVVIWIVCLMCSFSISPEAWILYIAPFAPFALYLIAAIIYYSIQKAARTYKEKRCK